MADIASTSPLTADSRATDVARSLSGQRVPGAVWLPQPPPERPTLALMLGDEVGDGWHAARLIQDRPNLDYYVQSITLQGPFRVTRPWRGIERDASIALAPDVAAASRTLSINWSWEPDPDGHLFLPIFIKRTGVIWLRQRRSVPARLVLKDMTIKGSVIRLKVRSNGIRWTRRAAWAVG